MIFFDIHTHNTKRDSYCSIFNLIYPENINLINEKNISVGFHPWQLPSFPNTQEIDLLLNIISQNNVIMVGETGLDKNKSADTELQIKFFSLHIELSEAIQKPLIIHNVKYLDEIIKLKKTIRPKQIWIIHGFRGKKELALQLIKQDFLLSFGNWFHPDSLYEAFKAQALFVESDNSNVLIEEIYTKQANSINIPLKKYTEIITNNIHTYLPLIHQKS